MLYDGDSDDDGDDDGDGGGDGGGDGDSHGTGHISFCLSHFTERNPRSPLLTEWVPRKSFITTVRGRPSGPEVGKMCGVPDTGNEGSVFSAVIITIWYKWKVSCEVARGCRIPTRHDHRVWKDSYHSYNGSKAMTPTPAFLKIGARGRSDILTRSVNTQEQFCR